ncbi:MAG: 2-amino-4-hydroxy-6-hydroxymethyldihydropteridine diphosphokinase, partial [Proteobacteria bacterium]|nr:2-amino-4-hydroxy-6-hydroxymethyldihydropteridine diphosphokinase [Pseudomonadota bacterium]
MSEANPSITRSRESVKKNLPSPLAGEGSGERGKPNPHPNPPLEGEGFQPPPSPLAGEGSGERGKPNPHPHPNPPLAGEGFQPPPSPLAGEGSRERGKPNPHPNPPLEGEGFQPPIRAYIGLGSNYGDSRRHLERAIAQLAALPKTQQISQARFYRTAPQGVTRRQPPYLNTVVALDTLLSVGELFAALRRIEREHRRARPYPNAPRTLDIDLLLYGNRISRSRRITLPHPRLHLRPFALIPLLDLENALIPGKGRAGAAIRYQRSAVKNQCVARISEAPSGSQKSEVRKAPFSKGVAAEGG